MLGMLLCHRMLHLAAKVCHCVIVLAKLVIHASSIATLANHVPIASINTMDSANSHQRVLPRSHLVRPRRVHPVCVALCWDNLAPILLFKRRSTRGRDNTDQKLLLIAVVQAQLRQVFVLLLAHAHVVLRLAKAGNFSDTSAINWATRGNTFEGSG